jgi:hypothetical protein
MLNHFFYHAANSSLTLSILKCNTEHITKLSQLEGIVPSAIAAIPALAKVIHSGNNGMPIMYK